MNRWKSAAAFVLLAGTACSTKTTSPQGDAPQDAGTTAQAIELPPGDGPVAKVNGKDIPRAVFNREFRRTLERYARARHTVKPALRERLKDNIVRRLIDAELIRQEAARMKVSVPADTLAEAWTAHKKRYGSEDAFRAFLERSGITEAEVKEQFTQNLLRERVFDEVAKESSVTEQALKDYYDKNKARYAEPEQVRARHILVRVAPKAEAAQVAERRKRAEEALKKIKGGQDFASVASEYSEDATKSRGGDLGFFAKGRMVKPFEDVAWKLKKNEVSGLVETQFGFHIIQKTDHKRASQKTFQDVKPQIEKSLTARARNRSIREALKRWKSAASIETFVKGDQEIIRADQAETAKKLKPAVGLQMQKLRERLKLKQGAPRPNTGDVPVSPTMPRPGG